VVLILSERLALKFICNIVQPYALIQSELIKRLPASELRVKRPLGKENEDLLLG